MEESMAYHKKVVDEELILMNGTYMAKEQETSTKQMAINRHIRIKAINLYICRDEKSNGFEEWDHFDSTPAVGRHLCICGMLLTEHSNTVSRRNALINVKACIGDTCIKCLDEIHNTKKFKKMKDQYKTCPHCEKRKNIYEEMCKKCKLKTICKTCEQSKPVNASDNCKACNEYLKYNKNCIDCKKQIDPKFPRCYDCNTRYNSNNCIDCKKPIAPKWERCYGCKYNV